jgi:hypothetical protein
MMIGTKWLRRPALAGAFTAGVLLAAGCDSPTQGDHDHDHEVPVEEMRRLMVTDLTAPRAHLVEVKDGRTLQSFTLDEPASALYASYGGRHAFVHLANTGLVEAFDGGIWAEDHGDHADLRTAQFGKTALRLQGPRPTHWMVDGANVSVFFDGSGEAAFFDEARLLRGEFAQTTVRGIAAHHGNALTLGGAFFVTVKHTPGGTPDSVKAFDASGRVLGAYGDCPAVHGDAANGAAAAWGCADGALVATRSGSGFTVRKLVPSGSLAGTGARNFKSRPGVPFFVAQMGGPGVRSLAKLDPVAGTFTPIAYPGTYFLSWEVTPEGDHLLVLDESGALHVYDARSMTALGSVAVSAPVPTAERSSAPQMAAAHGTAYVTSPKTGEVLEVDYVGRRVTRRFAVGGVPFRVAVLGVARDLKVEQH